MAIETKVDLVTVSVPNPVTPDKVALMVVDPAALPVAKPDPEIVATPVLEVAQTTEPVMSLLDPSAYCPIAVNC